MVESIGALLAERARISPDLEAQVEPARKLRSSFRDLHDNSNRIAGMLASRVRHGDRVAILMANSIGFAEVLFGAARLGAIAVPLNWRLTVPELSYQIEDCEPVVLIHDEAHAEIVSRLAATRPGLQTVAVGTFIASNDAGSTAAYHQPPAVDVGPDDGFLILYTSGTTGKPKGALHTHRSSLAWSSSTMATFENRYADRQLLVAPLFHIAALCVLLNAIHRGFTLVIMPAFDADEAWRLIEEERVTSMFAVPTMINMMRESAGVRTRRHDALRWIMCGAAPVPVTLIEAYAELGIDIHQVYGSTEAHGGIAVLAPADAHSRKGSTGRACMGMQIRVVDPEGRDVPPHERGELITRGPHLFREYWRQPEATAASFRDGWFYLGDIGRIDSDGFITVLDRSKDMIISGGENIYPAEIENVLMRDPGVSDVAVVGEPHERWGEQAVAFVVPKPGLDAGRDWIAGLEAVCAEALASYKRPRRYLIVEALPRNASGKVLKHVLRKDLATGKTGVR